MAEAAVAATTTIPVSIKAYKESEEKRQATVCIVCLSRVCMGGFDMSGSESKEWEREAASLTRLGDVDNQRGRRKQDPRVIREQHYNYWRVVSSFSCFFRPSFFVLPSSLLSVHVRPALTRPTHPPLACVHATHSPSSTSPPTVDTLLLPLGCQAAGAWSDKLEAGSAT